MPGGAFFSSRTHTPHRKARMQTTDRTDELEYVTDPEILAALLDDDEDESDV